jgi:penicillin-binding protein 2
MAGVSLHDRHLELQVYKNRVVIAAAFCLLAVLVLVVRLFILQIVDHDVFSTLSQTNRMRLTAIAPNRGLIYDRNGIVLAENRPSYQLELVPDEVKEIDATLEQLRKLIRIEESDIQRFRKELKRDRGFEPIPLRFNLSEGEVANFAVNRHRFPGVDIKGVLSRYYPFGAMTAPVLGYVSRIDEDDLDKLDEGNYRATTHIGKVGIEQYYENILHGTAGYKQVEVNVEGREIHVTSVKDPVPGSDLYLSIDIRLQTIAEAALGENSGSVVAIEPATGAVLVFVSKPSYDPALFVNGVSTEVFTALQQDPGRPLFNRALHGQYPPGSTVKPLYGLAALEQGVVRENLPAVTNCRVTSDVIVTGKNTDTGRESISSRRLSNPAMYSFMTLRFERELIRWPVMYASLVLASRPALTLLERRSAFSPTRNGSRNVSARNGTPESRSA